MRKGSKHKKNYEFVCLACRVKSKSFVKTKKYCDAKCKIKYNHHFRQKAFKSLTPKEKAKVIEECRAYYFELGREENGERRS